jgi:acetyl-CoA acetyltransferase
MRDIAVVGFHALPVVQADTQRSVAEVVFDATSGVIEQTGVKRSEIGFTCSGSCDYAMGQPFSFVMALDGAGAWPPIAESHVEMDGAWALYESWVRLQHGDVDVALVYAFGQSSLGNMADVRTLQLDPYVMAPLGPGPDILAALQARALIEQGVATERAFAEIVAANRNAALQRAGNLVSEETERDVAALMARPHRAPPLRAHDAALEGDGGAAILLAAGPIAERLCARPAWIRGIDHRIESSVFGVRDLTVPTSFIQAFEASGAAHAALDQAELHAHYASEEFLLRREIGLPPSAINASGGALCGDVPMVSGLSRIGHAAAAIHRGTADSTLGHATSGPCLQQNLVCWMEA